MKPREIVAGAAVLTSVASFGTSVYLMKENIQPDPEHIQTMDTRIDEINVALEGMDDTNFHYEELAAERRDLTKSSYAYISSKETEAALGLFLIFVGSAAGIGAGYTYYSTDKNVKYSAVLHK